jgi:hypothetical protein
MSLLASLQGVRERDVHATYSAINEVDEGAQEELLRLLDEWDVLEAIPSRRRCVVALR